MIAAKVVINEGNGIKTPAMFIHDEQYKYTLFIDNKGSIRQDVKNYTYCDDPCIKF